MDEQRRKLHKLAAALTMYVDLAESGFEVHRPQMACIIERMSNCFLELGEFEKADHWMDLALGMQGSCPAGPAQHAVCRDERFLPPEFFIRACASQTFAPAAVSEQV